MADNLVAATPLTAKQLHFCRCVAGGMTYAAAYREAYDVGPDAKPETQQTAGSKLMAKAQIRARVERLIADREKAVVRSAVSDREKVLAKLRQWIDPPANEDGIREVASASELKAAELLGRACGLYRDVIEDNRSRSSEEVQAEIEGKLLQILGDTSEVEALGNDSELDEPVGTHEVSGGQMH